MEGPSCREYSQDTLGALHGGAKGTSRQLPQIQKAWEALGLPKREKQTE